eukprot:2808563-Prymnesium_polylepis.1
MRTRRMRTPWVPRGRAARARPGHNQGLRRLQTGRSALRDRRGRWTSTPDHTLEAPAGRAQVGWTTPGRASQSGIHAAEVPASPG